MRYLRRDQPSELHNSLNSDRDFPDKSDTSEVIAEVRRASLPRVEFYVMNLFAAVVASYGLLSNSTAVVIGAMVIAALLGPISGIGLALVSLDKRLLERAAITLLTGVVEVFVVSFLIGRLHVEVPLTQELLSRTQPNLFDLIIALSGGAAGAYAMGRRVPGGTLIGVAIATALVPPLASSAIAASHGNWHLAQQAQLLFVTNLVAIQCAYSIVLYILDIAPREYGKGSFKRILSRMAPSLSLLIILAVVLGVILERSLMRQNMEARIRNSLDAALRAIPGSYLGEVVVAGRDSAYDVVASVRTANPIAPDTVRAIEESIRQSLDKPVQLTIRSVLVRVANRAGYLYEAQALKAALDLPQAGTSPLKDSLIYNDSIRSNMAQILVRDSLRTDSLLVDSLRVDSLQKRRTVDSIKRAKASRIRHN